MVDFEIIQNIMFVPCKIQTNGKLLSDLISILCQPVTVYPQKCSQKT